ncbi:unnamed protein product [Microthlaspi erraticum]|uniref:F-box domain-containing protein n=1 Tax=Microthlaspi erraticum TaxID=1685480 RepID=A0A6D2HE03_9BRAS|nr:unnamed protein product [Microthlaspi erraticum]
MKMKMKFCNLPSEIEEEILSRVPIKSLRQLRATSKGWYHHPCSKIRDSSKVMKRSNSSRFSLRWHLLCTNTEDKRFVAWKPFSGQTRWIQPRENGVMSSYRSYALGYDNKELCRSYKILRSLEDQTVEIYEFKSDSWRNLDDVSPGGSFESLGVSLKGNAYWISRRGGAKEYSLLSLTFSTERFQHHYLPFHEADCLGPYVLKEGLNNLALSVVKEDRLCLFYESATKSKTEIWMSSEIGETCVCVLVQVLSRGCDTVFHEAHISLKDLEGSWPAGDISHPRVEMWTLGEELLGGSLEQVLNHWNVVKICQRKSVTGTVLEGAEPTLVDVKNLG